MLMLFSQSASVTEWS